MPDTPGIPSTNLFGMEMSGYPGFYFCAVLLIVVFYIADADQQFARSA